MVITPDAPTEAPEAERVAGRVLVDERRLLRPETGMRDGVNAGDGSSMRLWGVALIEHSQTRQVFSIGGGQSLTRADNKLRLFDQGDDEVSGTSHLKYMLLGGAGIFGVLLLLGLPAQSAVFLAIALACPLMMVFMMGGHQGMDHGANERTDRVEHPPADSPQRGSHQH